MVFLQFFSVLWKADGGMRVEEGFVMVLVVVWVVGMDVVVVAVVVVVLMEEVVWSDGDIRWTNLAIMYFYYVINVLLIM